MKYVSRCTELLLKVDMLVKDIHIDFSKFRKEKSLKRTGWFD